MLGPLDIPATFVCFEAFSSNVRHHMKHFCLVTLFAYLKEIEPGPTDSLGLHYWDYLCIVCIKPLSTSLDSLFQCVLLYYR